ncbi:hypothetical protein NMD34_23560 (plasmid) [Escherichia coli]
MDADQWRIPNDLVSRAAAHDVAETVRPAFASFPRSI